MISPLQGSPSSTVEEWRLGTFISLHEEDQVERHSGIKTCSGAFQGLRATGVARILDERVMLWLLTRQVATSHPTPLSESVKVVEVCSTIGAPIAWEVARSISLRLKDLLLSRACNARWIRLFVEKRIVVRREGLKSGVITVIATDHAPHVRLKELLADILKRFRHDRIRNLSIAWFDLFEFERRSSSLVEKWL